MKFLSAVLLLFVSLPWYVIAAEFTLPPYVIKGPAQENFLKFQLKENKKLLIEKSGESGESEPQVFEANKLYTINLGKRICGQELSYQIKEVKEGSGTPLVISSQKMPAYACDPKQSLNFAFISDTQQGTLGEHDKIAELLKGSEGENLSFILHAGDIVQAGGSHLLWKKYFQQAHSYLAKWPIVSVVGNHEYYGDQAVSVGGEPANYHHYMRYPSDQSSGQGAYFFPQFALIVLNSNLVKLQPSGADEIQWQWLKEKLRETKSLGKKVILSFHHSPFSSSQNYQRASTVILRERLTSILEGFDNVVLVLTGHEHLYERSFKNGIHYLVAGPAGGTPNVPSQRNPASKFVKVMASAFSIIKVSEEKIEITTRDGKNNLIENFVIQ